jgi:hypothetical protein
MPAVVSVLGLLDGEALFAQASDDEIGYVSFVFDHQNPNAHDHRVRLQPMKR